MWTHEAEVAIRAGRELGVDGPLDTLLGDLGCGELPGEWVGAHKLSTALFSDARFAFRKNRRPARSRDHRSYDHMIIVIIVIIVSRVEAWAL